MNAFPLHHRGAALFLTAGLVAGPVAAETVDFTFDWPGGIEASVTYRGERVRSPAQGSVTQVVEGSYTLKVSDHPDGTLVQYTDADVDVDFGDVPDGPQRKLQELMVKAMSQPPSYIIDPAGDYVRLHGLDELRERLGEMMGVIVAEIPEGVRPQVKRMFDNMLTTEVLETGIVEIWNRDVGFWAGASLELGDWYEIEFTNRVAMLGNIDLPMRNRFRVVERVPCDGNDTGANCVRIESTSVVDDEDVAAAMEEFVARLGAQGSVTPSIKNLDQETRVILITDPATLRPFSVDASKETTVKMVVGELKQDGSQAERTRMTFAWRPPAGKKTAAPAEPPAPAAPSPSSSEQPTDVPPAPADPPSLPQPPPAPAEPESAPEPDPFPQPAQDH